MSRVSRLLVVIAGAAVMLGVAWSGHRAWEARSMLERSEKRLATVSGQLREVTELRTRPSRVSRSSLPASGMVGEVTAVLTRAGVPSSVMTSLTPGQESLLSGPGSGSHGSTNGSEEVRRRSQRLVLEPVTLPAMGRFLDCWRKAHPEWIVSSLEVTPLDTGLGSRADNAQASSGTTLTPVRVSLALESTVLVDRTPREDAVGVPGAHP
jgi:hypothetical protein